jgi:hypothetical protein
MALANHTLLNSGMLAQMNVARIALRKLAQRPEATADDVAAADLADELYHQHEAKQKTVDLQAGADQRGDELANEVLVPRPEKEGLDVDYRPPPPMGSK